MKYLKPPRQKLGLLPPRDGMTHGEYQKVLAAHYAEGKEKGLIPKGLKITPLKKKPKEKTKLPDIEMPDFASRCKDGIHQEKLIEATERRTSLVLECTDAERFVIEVLNNAGIDYKFQHIFFVGGSYYIADFYFPQWRIIIEIDGTFHREQRAKDTLRSEILKKKHKCTVVRFSNKMVFGRPEFLVGTLLKYRYPNVFKNSIMLGKTLKNMFEKTDKQT